MANLSVKIGKLKLNNPVLVASGTFGWGEEFKDVIDLSKLGAIITKTITLKSRKGNLMPRTIESPCGMLNSIGLKNDGIKDFLSRKIPFLSKVGTKVIVSVSGDSLQEFTKITKILDACRAVDAVELNISCPNVKGKTKLIAQDARATYKAVKAARRATCKTLITKLSPNVTDIVQIARAAQDAGSDGLSLINTIYGMSIDSAKRKPHLGNIFGGLSGPAIKPVALYMVYQVAQKIKLPIIASGGIMTAKDALEFILAGATAIAVGTGNFINPKASIEIVAGISKYLVKNKIKDINKLRKALII
ncbi:dihydroorotate dehydrogenase [Candidatus Omnitrophota bacterium]